MQGDFGESPGSWSLVVSGLRICDLKLQNNRLVQELYATLTRKPKLFVQVWDQRSDECVARVEVEGCQHSPITNEMKWPGEQTIKLGPLDPRGRLFVVFTLATQTKLSIGKHSVVTLASTKVALDAVPKILADEGAWFVEFLPLRGTSCGPKSKIGVQLALMPTEEDGWFDLPDTPTSSASASASASFSPVESTGGFGGAVTPLSPRGAEPMAVGAMDGGEDTEERDPREEMDVFAAEAVSERIVDLLEEAWTAGTIGRSPSAATTPDTASSSNRAELTPTSDRRVSHVQGARDAGKPVGSVAAPMSIRVHLHKICDLHNFNFLSLTGNTSIYAVLHHHGHQHNNHGSWKRSRAVPKSSTPSFNDIFEFQVHEPTSRITVAFVEEVHMPFSGMKERFRTSRLLGKIEIQPSCFPANKKCHLRMNLLSYKLIQRASPYVLVSVSLAYDSLVRVLDVYRSPLTQMSRQRPAMETMPDELKALSTEDLMDLWSRSGDYSLTASITSARRTLRRAKSAKQEAEIILEPFASAFAFLRSWRQPVATVLVLAGYCRLCLTPRYIPSVLLLLVAAVPLYQYQSNVQYSILFKSQFVNYKTWRGSEAARMAEGVDQDGEPSVSPRSEHLGEADHVIHDPRDYDDADVADRASAEISKRDPRVASTTETQSSNLRRRIKTVARISQEFSSNVARISSQLERLLHLFFWTDPRLSTLFVSCCLACALVLLVVPPNYVAILCGLYLMRPPQFRDAEDGLATTLWSRLPDNSDAF